MRLPSKALRLGGIVIVGAGLVIGSAACDGGAATDPPTSTAAMSAASPAPETPAWSGPDETVPTVDSARVTPTAAVEPTTISATVPAAPAPTAASPATETPARSGTDENASTVDSARVTPTAAVEPTTVSATAPAAPAPTAARAIPASTTVPEVAKPTPSPTEIPLPYVESEDGSVLIMYEVPTSQEDMERDLDRAQHLVTELVKRYGEPPGGQLILKRGLHAQWGDSFITVPQASIPFDLCQTNVHFGHLQCGFAIHELGHYFTAFLLRTDQLWFNEGLSIAIQIAEVDGFVDMDAFDLVEHVESLQGPLVKGVPQREYKMLKSGTSIFRFKECGASRVENGQSVPVTWPCVNGLSAHSAGFLFFYALALDYGINGPKAGDFLRVLVKLAKDGRRIGTEDLKTAAMEVSGKDIGPLLDLLEPAIVFNGYDLDDKGVEFIESHPEYGTEETSWID